MKFTALSAKFDKLLNINNTGSEISQEKFEELLHLLREKKLRYETKLHSGLDNKKKEKLETRLKVVEAQIEKLTNLLSR